MCVIVLPLSIAVNVRKKTKKKVSIFLHFPLAECSKEERKASCVFFWFFLAGLKERIGAKTFGHLKLEKGGKWVKKTKCSSLFLLSRM